MSDTPQTPESGPPDPLAWINAKLKTLDRAGLRRHLPEPLDACGPEISVGGRRLVNFATNDYLGLAADPRLAEAAAGACRSDGVGRGASPLVCGRSRLHAQLEARLAELEGSEAALLFPSGFAANSGIIPTLVGRGDLIFSDDDNHASIVDGCRLARAETVHYPHADADALEQLLRESPGAGRKLVVTDTVFSIDGDVAPLEQIAGACARHGAMLMVDEAHATGVFGPTGAGVSETLKPLGLEADVRVGTLSKALGSSGGFVAGSRELIQWISNRARSYIFSTAHPAASSAAALTALDIVRDEPQRRTAVLDRADLLRRLLAGDGWDTGRSTTQIVPVLLGTPQRTVRAAALLREAGFWVGAIRPPSVPPGGSVLRIGVTASHTEEMIERLIRALRAVKERLPIEE